MTDIRPMLAAELGDSWAAQLHRAGWNRARLEMELSGQVDWKARLRADVGAATAILVTPWLTRTLESGPVALAEFDLPELARLAKHPTLRALADDSQPGEHGRLVLGPTGIGKTVAGIALMRRSMALDLVPKAPRPDSSDDGNWDLISNAPVNYAWVRALDLPNARLQQSFGKGEADLVDRAAKARFLVLDDMGWESKRAQADDVVLEVIARRYDSGLTTYITSGLSRAAFTERYGDAVERRITEAGGKPGKTMDLWAR